MPVTTAFIMHMADTGRNFGFKALLDDKEILPVYLTLS